MTDRALFSISNSEEVGWLRVEINSATEMSFDVQIPKGGFGKLFGRICEFAPVASDLDAQIAEAADDGGRTKVDEGLIEKCRLFARWYVFKNVDCALPGFEEYH